MRRAGGADGIGEDILAWLARAPGAAFVVSPQDAMLLATNAAGAKALGFETEFDGAMPLDSAMPAIMDLRRAAKSGMQAQAGKPMPLVFWTPDGVARLVCQVRWSGEPGPQRRALIAVEPPVDTQDGLPDAAGFTAANSAAATTAIRAPEPHPPAAVSPMPAPPPAASAKSETIERREEPSATPRDAAMPRPPPERTTARTVAAAAQPHPAVSAAPLTPPPPSPPRSDDETLKAIARQILAGRQALAQSGSDRGPATPSSLPHEQPDAAAPRPLPARTSHSEEAPRSAAEVGASQPPRKSPGTPPTPREAKKPAAPPISAAPAAQPPAAPTPTAQRATAATALEHIASEPQSSERRNLLRRIAHELKTPVSAIASAAEIMKDERFGAIGDARYLRYARDIHASAHHALQVIERMLGRRASDEAGARELAFTDLELNALLSEVVSSLEVVAIEAGITFRTELATRLPLVVADATSVRQILINTLTNALKFSPRGSAVTICSHAAPAGPLTITVADNGPGMPSDEIARIVAGATDSAGGDGQERPGGGFGIGLPLSMKLAAANGATLAIESKPGEGTRVTLAFPGNRQVPV